MIRVAIFAVLTLAACGMQAAELEAVRLQRDKLLTFVTPAGEVAPVKTVEDWQKRRASVLAAMQEVMGPLPGNDRRCALDVKVVEESDEGTYVRRLLSYQAELGGRVPAYLLIPKDALAGTRKAAGVLCLHPTDNTNGHKVVVGLGGKENRNYAQELALRGYVALAPSYPLLANYQPGLAGLGYVSGTMKAIWDNIRGLDLIESLPFVKPGGFAAIGHSLGGHNSIYTAVFDERIKVIVSSCGFDSYRDYFGGDAKRWQPEQGWCQTRYMPRMANYAGRLQDIPFDFYEMIGALAPRSVFVNAPLRDANFKWESVDRIATAAREVFQLYGKPGNLTVDHPDSEHDFPDEMREKAYRIIDESLK